MGVVPIEGELFEDFIDGYFPLNVSLGHMLDRHGFASAWILMRVAPMMDIPDLAETEPVPLHLDPAHGGQIDWLSATIRLSGQTASLSGQARWNWNDPLKTNKDKIPSTLAGVNAIKPVPNTSLSAYNTLVPISPYTTPKAPSVSALNDDDDADLASLGCELGVTDT